ncbi:hypothetical protein MTO96_037776 [Rhipicephalus appendiculatus]
MRPEKSCRRFGGVSGVYCSGTPPSLFPGNGLRHAEALPTVGWMSVRLPAIVSASWQTDSFAAWDRSVVSLSAYGRGCTLAFNLQEEERGSSARVDSVVNEILPQSKRLRAYKGRHEYQLDKGLSWGTVFSKVEELKAALRLDDIWLSPATLEDVFTEFAILRTDNI